MKRSPMPWTMATMVVVVLSAVPWAQQARAIPVAQTPAPSTTILTAISDTTAFNPQAQRTLVYRDSELTLKLVKRDDRLSIGIQHRQGPTTEVPLPRETVQVNDIRRDGEICIITGMVNGSVSEITLVNLSSAETSGEFYAYKPSISPNGRMIAFLKFYPPHFVEGTSDIDLLLAVNSLVAEKKKGEKAIDRINIGARVFPSGAGNQEGDNTGVPEQAAHRFLSRSFFWAPDSSRYVFADESAGRLNLVMVAIGSGQPKALTRPVSENDLCAPLSKTKCLVNLSDVQFASEAILVRFTGVGVDSALDETIRINYDEFGMR